MTKQICIFLFVVGFFGWVWFLLLLFWFFVLWFFFFRNRALKDSIS